MLLVTFCWFWIALMDCRGLVQQHLLWPFARNVCHSPGQNADWGSGACCPHLPQSTVCRHLATLHQNAQHTWRTQSIAYSLENYYLCFIIFHTCREPTFPPCQKTSFQKQGKCLVEDFMVCVMPKPDYYMYTVVL